MIDYLNNENSNLKAIGMMIFCGSSTIGAMNSGFNVKEILEISDDIVKQNAYHFIKNSNSIPVVIPSKWENEEYLLELKSKNLDLIYANCPCSSLSQINRTASVDGKNNIHFYRLFDSINTIEPKSFIIENAPTLIALGYPIIKDLTHKLGDKYRFTIIRDNASNHNVAMKRTRTMVVGWRKDVFNGIPLLHADKQEAFTTKDAIGDLYNKELDPSINHVCVENREWKEYEHLFNLVEEGGTSLKTFINHWDKIKDQFAEKDAKKVQKAIDKLATKNNIWDKTPCKAKENGLCPSMASVTQLIHPKQDRQFTIREYSRLMGYPDEFIFYPEECETPIIQCIAQGVPANFMQYITTEIKEAILNNRELIEDSENKILNFQNNLKMKYELFNQMQIDEMTVLEVSKTANNLIK